MKTAPANKRTTGYDNTIADNTNSCRKKDGLYSPNGIMLFVLLLFVVLLPFSADNLTRYAHRISQPSLKSIYHAVTEPIIDFSAAIHTTEVNRIIRRIFLQHTGLEMKTDWDSFFYADSLNEELIHDEKSVILQNRNIVLADKSERPAERVYRAGSAEKKIKRPYRVEQIVIPYSSEHPLRILFFGDSQMHYLASGMRRAIGNNDAIQMEAISVHSSGFLRSDYYNWPKKLQTVLGECSSGSPFHAVVMLLGMNDYQDIYIGGKLLRAGSSEWEKFYRKKVLRHINIALQYVPKIYRLGLPQVRSKKYNHKLEYLEKIQADIVKEYSHVVVDISFEEATGGLGTNYLETVKADTGEWINVMQGDGIHYTIACSEYIMHSLLAHLNEDFLFK